MVRHQNLPALHKAAMEGNLEVMRSVLEGGEDVDASSYDSCDKTALAWAVEYGREEAALLLLNSGAVLHCYDRGPIYQAVQMIVPKDIPEGEEARVLAVRMKLLKKWANDHVVGFSGLGCAVRAFNAEAVQLLIDQGVEVNGEDGSSTALSQCNHSRTHALTALDFLADALSATGHYTYNNAWMDNVPAVVSIYKSLRAAGGEFTQRSYNHNVCRSIRFLDEYVDAIQAIDDVQKEKLAVQQLYVAVARETKRADSAAPCGDDGFQE